MDANVTTQAMANMTAGFSHGINGSINLTGQITAYVVQPMHEIAIIASAGIIGAIVGGLITGAVTLRGVEMTQKNEKNRDERKRKDDERKALREERKEAYVDLISNLLLMSSSQKAIDLNKLAVSITRTKLLASPRVIVEIENFQLANLSERDIINSTVNNMIKLMAEELQQEDVYAAVHDLQEKTNSLSQ